MKSISAFAIFVAATLITAGSASAQSNMERANVPFDFTVGNKTLPAGTCTIRSELSSPELLTISNVDKGVRLIAFGQPSQNNPKHANSLVFDRVGDKYYLREIRSSSSAMDLHFSATKAEKKARAQVQEAGRFVDDPVLIALN